jgi:putative DNA primase/helicase
LVCGNVASDRRRNEMHPDVQRLNELGQAPLDGGNGEVQAMHDPHPLALSDALLDYAAMLKLAIPERSLYLPWLPEGGNVMVYGPRGVGKTFLQLGLTAALTTGTRFLRWPVAGPVGVLYVDGEMQLDELRTRMTALLPEPPKASLKFLTSEWVYHTLHQDLVLTSDVMRSGIMILLDEHPDIRVLILDNVSCLFAGIDEDKKRDWEPIAAWLIRLRHRGLATVLVHHSGKGGHQRGTSGREDALDTVICLDSPADYDPREGCHFELRFTKSRSVKGEDVASLDVRLEDVGGRWVWTYKLLERSKEEEVKELLDEGMTSASEIAEALGITRSYAWKLMRRVEQKRGGEKRE